MTDILLTDSMDKIQKKLSKGGSICFQRGTYKITKQLILKEGSYITLNGSILKRCGNIQSVFLNECSAKTTVYKGPPPTETNRMSKRCALHSKTGTAPSY